MVEICDHLVALSAVLDLLILPIVADQQEALRQADHLFHSLLHDAFAGAL